MQDRARRGRITEESTKQKKKGKGSADQCGYRRGCPAPSCLPCHSNQMRSSVSDVITSSAQFHGSRLSALIIKSTAEGKG